MPTIPDEGEDVIVVKVDGSELFDAMTEIETGAVVEWVSTDGRIVRLEPAPEED